MIPAVEKGVIGSDCDSGWSDRESQGETGHFPARLLNSQAKVTYLEDEEGVNLINPDLPSEHFVSYGPTAADCIKQTKSDSVDLFLVMYPPTLRELAVEMSNI